MSSTGEKMIDKMNEDRERDHLTVKQFEQHGPEILSDNDEEGEEEIFGYECLGCGHVQDHPGECEMCNASAVDPMYF